MSPPETMSRMAKGPMRPAAHRAPRMPLALEVWSVTTLALARGSRLTAMATDPSAPAFDVCSSEAGSHEKKSPSAMPRETSKPQKVRATSSGE